jgi:hypothetical protein
MKTSTFIQLMQSKGIDIKCLSRKHRKIAIVIFMRGYDIIAVDSLGIWYNDSIGSTHLYRIISNKAIANLDKGPHGLHGMSVLWVNNIINNLYTGGAQY